MSNLLERGSTSSTKAASVILLTLCVVVSATMLVLALVPVAVAVAVAVAEAPGSSAALQASVHAHVPYAPTGQTDIVGPPGSGAFGKDVTVLPNGNIVVTDPSYDEGGVTDIGAVYLYDGATLNVISVLKGSAQSDQVGNYGIRVLTNGNFVVRSPDWDNPTGPVINAGAVTWCSATSGCSGTVSSSNSLVGGTAYDQIGSYVVTALTNGNYVVSSYAWDNPSGSVTDAGAVTWGSGTSGVTGVVSTSNSLVGGAAGDQVGNYGATALPNGNYVVISPEWHNPDGPFNNAGAVTLGNGTSGTTGVVSSSNSLVGGTANDRIGSSWVTVLTNGNYVVASPQWDNPAGAVTDAGAVTWGSGTSGVTGVVSASNSLVGSTANDQVGSYSIETLTNGNYVVVSTKWDNPAGPIADVGAVTWGSGTSGVSGPVSASNSLVGSTASDQIGNKGVLALTNGNYVVSSPLWDNPSGPVADVGAATWGSGTSGVSGPVSTSNSLVGGTAGDQVGIGLVTGVTPLTNGNYVVSSYMWDDPTGPVTDAGAVTWGNGATGTTGVVSASNSLVGSTANDQVGYYMIAALTNGNYVVISILWDNPTGPVVDAGAVTWGSGTSGVTGPVSPSNSLVGGSANDKVGYGGWSFGVVALTNGNYVVSSPWWDDPSGPATDAGAVTWGSGSSGVTGVVSSSNSLVGSTANDQVGQTGPVALTNGNYVVSSYMWDNPSGPVTDAGAVTWGSGTSGISGPVSSSNSLVGSTANDQAGYSGGTSGLTALSNGNYVVISPWWDNPSGPATDAGAVTLGDGTAGTRGPVSSSNSVLGTVTHGIGPASYDYTRDRLAVGRAESNIVSIFSLPAAPTATPTSTGTRTGTATPTPTDTATPTETATITDTATETATGTSTATDTRTSTPSSTATPSSTGTSTGTSTATATSTSTNTTGTSTATSTATNTTGTATGTPTKTTVATHTSTATSTATATSTSAGNADCEPFSDVQPGDTFYTYINCLYCHGVISGYSDNTFRAGGPVTRGQIAKIVSNAAGFQEDPGPQIYSDVPPGSPFYAYINRLTRRGIVAGYPCPAKPVIGAPGDEPCSPKNPQLFRPNFNATRGQLAKIVSNAAGYNENVSGKYYADVPPSGEGSQFYTYIMRLTSRGVVQGYQCGTSDPRSGPCDDQHRPYFRPGNEVTRGQAAKIVANTFFPNCQPSAKP